MKVTPKFQSIQPGQPDRYLTMAEVCDLTRYCRRTVMAALAQKALTGCRQGNKGRWRIRLSQVERWMKGLEI